jgi:hypothetical protein
MSLLIRRDATLRIWGALHLGIFEQPAKNDFFRNPLNTYASSPLWRRNITISLPIRGRERVRVGLPGFPEIHCRERIHAFLTVLNHPVAKSGALSDKQSTALSKELTEDGAMAVLLVVAITSNREIGLMR